MSKEFGLVEFADEVRDVCAKKLSSSTALETLRPHFERLLGNRRFLAEKLATIERISNETRLYHDPEYDFVILARGVGKQGKVADFARRIMPHDHGPLWAMYGVYEGEQSLQRYSIDPESKEGQFPGLALVSEMVGKTGAQDDIEPHNLHLPVAVGEGAITIVVYNRPLETVPRLGYLPELQDVVEFMGQAPPLSTLTQREGIGLGS